MHDRRPYFRVPLEVGCTQEVEVSGETACRRSRLITLSKHPGPGFLPILRQLGQKYPPLAFWRGLKINLKLATKNGLLAKLMASRSNSGQCKGKTLKLPNKNPILVSREASNQDKNTRLGKAQAIFQLCLIPPPGGKKFFPSLMLFFTRGSNCLFIFRGGFFSYTTFQGAKNKKPLSC